MGRDGPGGVGGGPFGSWAAGVVGLDGGPAADSAVDLQQVVGLKLNTVVGGVAVVMFAVDIGVEMPKQG